MRIFSLVGTRIAIIGMLFLSSCATVAPPPKESLAQLAVPATVYLFRPKNWDCSVNTYIIKANGKEVVRLKNGTYYVFETTDPNVRFSSNQAVSPLNFLLPPVAVYFAVDSDRFLGDFEFEGGAIYYLEFDPHPTGFSIVGATTGTSAVAKVREISK